MAGLWCSRAKTVTYLDKESVKLGDRDDGSRLLVAGLQNPEVVKDEQRTSSSTYLGCSRAKTVTLLPPGSQCCTPLKTSFLIPEPGQAGDSCTPHLRDG